MTLHNLTNPQDVQSATLTCPFRELTSPRVGNLRVVPLLLKTLCIQVVGYYGLKLNNSPGREHDAYSLLVTHHKTRAQQLLRWATVWPQ